MLKKIKANSGEERFKFKTINDKGKEGENLSNWVKSSLPLNLGSITLNTPSKVRNV